MAAAVSIKMYINFSSLVFIRSVQLIHRIYKQTEPHVCEMKMNKILFYVLLCFASPLSLQLGKFIGLLDVLYRCSKQCMDVLKTHTHE